MIRIIIGVLSKSLLIIIIFAFAHTLSSEIKCQSHSPNYYPLEKGYTWDYEMMVISGSRKISNQVIRRNKGIIELGGNEYYEQETNIRGNLICNFYKELPSVGMLEYGKYNPKELVIKSPARILHSSPIYVFKYPIKWGTEWEESYTTKLLNEKLEGNLRCMIEDTDAQIQVRAGLFKNALEIHKRGILSKRSRLIGKLSANIHIIEYYVEDVGLVKAIVKEDGIQSYFTKGKAVIELIGIEKPN